MTTAPIQRSEEAAPTRGLSSLLNIDPLLFLAGIGLIIFGLAALVWLIPAAPMTGDGQHYIEFVRNNLQHGASSWHERRLLGPVIVRALPLDAQAGFFVLTTVSLAVTSFLTWMAARDVLGRPPRSYADWVAAHADAFS